MKRQTIYKIKKRLLNLAQLGKYKKGVSVIEKCVKQDKKIMDEILPTKAFFLYHHAANLMYNQKTTSLKNKKKILTYFNQAIAICKKIIKKKDRIDKRDYLNTRLYLAQIYVMLKQKKKAKKLSIQTYKYSPSSLTAERVADIYMRSGDLNNAIVWYKKAVKKGKLKTAKLIAQIGIVVCYKKKNNIKQATKEALVALKFFKQSKKDKNALILKKSLLAHFPALKK